MAIKFFDREANNKAICDRVGEVLNGIKDERDVKIEINREYGKATTIRYDVTELIIPWKENDNE